MPSSRTALAALPALPAGTVALLAHSATYALVIPLLGKVIAALPILADVIMRWRTHRIWLEQERLRTEALRRIGQDNPERLLELLPPPGGPIARSMPLEGPAPPVAPPGDPAAGEGGTVPG